MGETSAGFSEVVLYNVDGDAIAVVKRDSTSTQLPVGANPGVVLVGGVQTGTPDTYRGLDMDSSGRPPARLYDAAGNAINSTSNALHVRVASQAANLNVDIAAQTLAAVKVSATAAANTAANPLYIAPAVGGTALTATGNALDVNLKSVTNTNVPVSKNTTANALANPLATQLSDGTNAIGVTANPLFVNNKDGSGNALTSTTGALDVNLKSVTGTRVPISKDTNVNAVANPISVALSDGTNALGTSGNPIYTAGSAGTGIPAADAVVQRTILNTTTTGANQVIVTYTVPTGKTLYLLHLSVCMAPDVAINGDVTVNVAGSAWARVAITGYYSGKNAGTYDWQRNFPVGIPIATAGQVVNITITPSGTTSTYWTGLIVGFLR